MCMIVCFLAESAFFKKYVARSACVSGQSFVFMLNFNVVAFHVWRKVLVVDFDNRKGRAFWSLFPYIAVINVLYWVGEAYESSSCRLWAVGLLLPLIVCKRWFRIEKGRLFVFCLGGWFTAVRLFFSDHYVSFALSLEKTEPEPLSPMFYLLSTLTLLVIVFGFVTVKTKSNADLSVM